MAIRSSVLRAGHLGALDIERRVLPIQWHAAPADLPERALCRAILEDAIDLARKPVRVTEWVRSGPRLALEARAWIASDSEDGVHTFRRICEVLGYAPEYVRRKVGVST